MERSPARMERIFPSWSEAQQDWSEYFRHGAESGKVRANFFEMERLPSRQGGKLVKTKGHKKSSLT